MQFIKVSVAVTRSKSLACDISPSATHVRRCRRYNLLHFPTKRFCRRRRWARVPMGTHKTQQHAITLIIMGWLIHHFISAKCAVRAIHTAHWIEQWAFTISVECRDECFLNRRFECATNITWLNFYEFLFTRKRCSSPTPAPNTHSSQQVHTHSHQTDRRRKECKCVSWVDCKQCTAFISVSTKYCHSFVANTFILGNCWNYASRDCIDPFLIYF